MMSNQARTVKIDTDSRAFRLFVGSLKSKSTREAYILGLKNFMEYAKLETVDDLLKLEPKVLQDKIIDFVMEERKRLSYASVHVKLAALRKFCIMSDILINWPKVSAFLGEHRKTVSDRIYTREEIQRMIKIASFKDKVIVHILLSTGVRIGALPDLRVRHLTKIPETGIYRFVIYEKSREEYITFCTPECAVLIDDYLAYRARAGETIGGDSPVIREDFNPNDPEAVRSPRSLTVMSYRAQIRALLIRTGIRPHSKTRERKELMLAHAFRKFFNTTMIRCGAKPVIKELLLGHGVNLDNSYYRPTVEELMVEYEKAIPELTMADDERLKLEVSTLQSDIEGYRTVELEIAQKNKELKELRAKMEAIESNTEKLIETKVQTILGRVDVTKLRQK